MDVIKQYFEESKESVRALIPTEVFEFDQADNDGKLKNYQITPQQFETALINKFSDAQKHLSYLAGHLEDHYSQSILLSILLSIILSMTRHPFYL